MNELLERFGRLTAVQKVLIFVLINLILVLLFYWYVYSPNEKKIANHSKNLQNLEVKLAESKAIAQDLPKFRAEVEELDAELAVALKLLPNKSEIPALLKKVSNLGTKVGLEFSVFRPSNDIIKGFYAEIPVDIEVSGGYHEIAQFFDHVGKLQRIVNIKNIKIGKPTIKSNKVILKTNVLAVTFRFVEEEELKASQEAKRKPRR
jgi:type IV pilus assembly protein PilO